jgi:hypothetical protein
MTAYKQSQDGTVEFYGRINLDKKYVWLVIKKKSVTTHGNMIVKWISRVRFSRGS